MTHYSTLLLRILSPHLLLLSCLIASACSRYHLPKKQTQLPTKFNALQTSQQKSQVNSVAGGDPWWMSFQDAKLNEYLHQVFTHNLQLKQAKERLIQMRSIAVQFGSDRWPNLSVNLGWSRTKQLNPLRNMTQNFPARPGSSGGNSSIDSTFTQDSYQASLSVSYEVDIWGRLGSLVQAAEKDAIASKQDLKGVAITLSANAVGLWFDLLELQLRQKIIKAQLASDESQLELTQLRFQQGSVPHTDVLQQMLQRDRTQAQLPLLNAQQNMLQRQLAALLGRSTFQKSHFSNLQNLPQLSEVPSIGLPMKVLMNRPDVKAIQARLSSADARVSAATSARLPALRIGATAGYQSFDPNELFDDWIWSLSTNIVAPLFQAGRLKAEQQRQEAMLRETLHGLSNTLIIAYHEVENAIDLERAQQAHLSLLATQLITAQDLLESMQNRYMEGVGDLITILNAKQSLYSTQLAHLASHRSLMNHRIQLHKAIAGDWVDQLVRELPATQKPTTQEPATQKPATQKPATQKPATQESATQESASQESASQESASQESASHALSSHTPSTHTPSTHTLSTHTLSTHTLSTHTLSTRITTSTHPPSTHTVVSLRSTL